MNKKRTMNEYRQTKEYTSNPWALYGPPQIGSEGEVINHDIHSIAPLETKDDQLLFELKQLRKQYPNDQEFGKRVAIIIR